MVFFLHNIKFMFYVKQPPKGRTLMSNKETKNSTSQAKIASRRNPSKLKIVVFILAFLILLGTYLIANNNTISKTIAPADTTSETAVAENTTE